MGFLSGATGVLGLASAGLGLVQAIKGDDDLDDAQKAAGQQAGISTEAQQFALDLARASIDPRDPRYQALIQESRDADFQALLMGHQQQAIQRERQRARGGLSTTSDRQDEAHQRSFRALDYPGVANDRRAQARAVLQNAANMSGIGMSGGAAGTAGSLANDQRNVQAGGISMIGAGLETADRNLPAFESLFASQPAKFSTSGTIEQARALPNVRLNSGPR